MKWYDPWCILADMFLLALATTFLFVWERIEKLPEEEIKARLRDRIYLIKTTPKNWRF